jgi:hypothetical protein
MALNTILGVAAEAVAAAAEIMLLPSLILAFFVAELTPSYTTIGLVPAIAAGFWTLARVPAYLLTSARRRQQPWAFAAALVRAAAIVVLAVVASRTDPVRLGQSARPLIGTFFLCLILFALAGGFGSVPTTALMRTSIRRETWDGFAHRRALWSSGLSVLAALVVARLLGSGGLAFPGNYGRLFLTAAVCLIAVAAFTAAMREPWVAAPSHAVPAVTPRALRQPLYDDRYRRFLLFRVLLSATAAVDPFLFLYAVTRLGAPVTAIGGYVIASVLGWVIAAPAWRWIAFRAGPRAVLQGAAVVRLLAPAVALVLPQVGAAGPMRERFEVSTLTTIYGAAFFAIGAALAAQSRGNFDYLAAIAPRPLFPTSLVLTNAVLAVVAFAPVLGGALIQRSGYEILFGVVAVIGLAAVFTGGWLADTPAVGRDQAGSNRGDSRGYRALTAGRS